MKRAIIFDFDGTLADTFGIFVELLDSMTKQTKHLDSDAIESLRELSASDAMRKLHISPLRAPLLLYDGRRLMLKYADKIELFPGIIECVQSLSTTYDLYILSSNGSDVIAKTLERAGLSDCFHKIYAGTGLSGKARRIQKLCREQELLVGDCVYVGDEVRDIDACRKIGASFIMVG